MTRRPTARNPKRPPDERRHGPWGWALGLPLALALFAAGWLAGRRGCSHGDDPAAATPGVPSQAAPQLPRPPQVQLRLDAAAVTLLPEGGLELPRLAPLDSGAATAEDGGEP